MLGPLRVRQISTARVLVYLPKLPVLIAELNAVDRLGDRAKENPNSDYQRHPENDHADDSPEWRGAVLIPLGSNHEVDCAPHVQFPSCRLGLMRRTPA